VSVVAKSRNYALWYMQQRAEERLAEAIKQCRFAQLDEDEVIALVRVMLLHAEMLEEQP
jgi:hypothetical protein